MNTAVKSKKVTLATIKAFVRKNADNLFVKVNSSFDGMTDCVQKVEDNFREVSEENALGQQGVWCVGGSRDYFTPFENDTYVGFKVSNCCGSGIITTKKTKSKIVFLILTF